MRRLPAAVAFGVAIAAFATRTSALDTRPTTFKWDNAKVLRGTFEYDDAFDKKAITRLNKNGLAVTMVMRGYVYPVSGGDPVALTAHSCKVVYDLWNEVYFVTVNDGKKSPPIISMKGVYRLCSQMKELPIVERAVLKGSPKEYYLGVKVEVDPMDPKLVQEIQRWVTRPLGVSGSISAGDALFATFVGVFMSKKAPTAQSIVEFRTPNFPP